MELLVIFGMRHGFENEQPEALDVIDGASHEENGGEWLEERLQYHHGTGHWRHIRVAQIKVPSLAIQSMFEDTRIDGTVERLDGLS